MSDPVRASRSEIKSPSNVVQTRNGGSGVCSSADGGAHIKLLRFPGLALGMRLSDAVGVSTSVRPGRDRNRTKSEQEDKIKKPAEDVRKKSPPARKAPARGRYVDEYARPAR